MAEPRPLRLGDPPRLGRYRLEARLGAGGQGVVYLGRDPEERPVAVKLLRAELGQDAELRSRFARELEVVERVAGFCTARVLDAGVAEDQPYIVSEYVPGRSLQELVAAEGPRAGSELERLAVGTSTALAAVHRAGIVHRDFKPANVLMGPDGPRVIDFGIARMLDAGADSVTASGVVGTPAYMAPEQIAGQRVTPAGDVFAWAATMAYAATGRPPFAGDSIPSVINRITHGEPDLSGVPGELRDVLGRCLAKDPAARPTAERLLLTMIGDRTAPATILPPAPRGAAPRAASPNGPVPPGRTAPRRRTALIAAGTAAAAIVLVAAATGVWLYANRPGDQVALPSDGPALLRTASAHVRTFVSYDYRRFAADVRAAHAVMTPALRKKYDAQMTGDLGRTVKRQKAISRATIAAAGLESSTDDRATALVVLTQRTSGEHRSAPATTTTAVRAGLARHDGTWRLDQVTPLPATPATAPDGSWPPPETAGILTAARTCATAMHSVDYRRIDGTIAAVTRCGTGTFRSQWTKNAARLRAAITRTKTVTTASTIEPALASATPARASVILVAATTTRAKSAPSPAHRTLLYRAALTRTGGKWRIANLDVIT